MRRNTYSSGDRFAAVVGVAAELRGSAAQTIMVTKVIVSSDGSGSYVLRRNSTLAAGGTFVSPGILAHDQANPVATAILQLYTVAPAAGAAIANVRAYTFSTPGMKTEESRFAEELLFAQPIILRGATDTLTVLSANVFPIFNVSFEWEETLA